MLYNRLNVIRPPSRSVVILGVVFMFALIVRVAWTVWTAPVPPFLSDAGYYNATALSISRGDGYSVVFSGTLGWLPGGDASAFWPPGYSAFLAVGYLAFGEHLAVARAANVLIGSFTVVPVYFIGRRLLDEKSALVGALLTASLPSLVFWTPVLLSDTLFTFLFAASIAFFLHGWGSDERFHPRPIVLAAAITGIACFVRGQGVMLIPIVAMWWMMVSQRRRESVGWGAIALVIALVIIAPWSVRNDRALGSPIVLSTNLGYNLRIGHASYTTGRYIVPQDLWDADPGISFQQREIVFNDLGTRRGIRYAATHPRDELGLSLRKVEWLWRPDSDVLTHVSSYGITPLPTRAWEPLRLTLDATYLLFLALAGLGLFRLGRSSQALPFIVLLVAGWTGVHVAFFGEPRYHLPLLAVLAPFAARPLGMLIPTSGDLASRRSPVAEPTVRSAV